MNKHIIIFALLICSIISYAQKKTYDIVTFNTPSGWTSKDGNGFLSYSKIDGSSWGQIAVYQHRTSEGDIQRDFDKDWRELVTSTSRGISAPEKTPPQTAEGWTVMSGSGVWQFNGANVATILTVYSNTKVCVSVLCNATAQPYLKDYQALIGSLDLDATKVPVQVTTAPVNSSVQNTTPASATNTTSLSGLWIDYFNETSGYVNGMPMLTAGYFRKEYLFNTDGTYVFRLKNWLVSVKDILFVYESGTYTVSGNQFTISPQQGKGGWWSKTKTGRTNEWGSFASAYDYKPEKVTYAFEIKYFSGSQNYSLILKPGESTVRDGDASRQSDGFNYSKRTLETLIDNPPGFSVVSNSKPAVSSQPALAGRLWEGITLEKSGSGNMQFNSGGFFTCQYLLNADGTYRFVNVNASSFTDTKSLKYETGTWSVNGNQLTIMPARGADEEWSKTGKISNGNSDTANRSVNETWGSKLKTASRKLEQYTYTFSIEKNGDKTALVLKRNGRTEREGDGSVTYLNETLPAKSVKLPAGF